jgi:hypothetical protein
LGLNGLLPAPFLFLTFSNLVQKSNL